MSGRITTADKVRALPGPFATRECTSTPEGYVWSEVLVGETSSYLDAAALSTVGSLPATNTTAALLPSSAEGPNATWPALDRSELLFDRIFQREIEDMDRHVREFRGLGAFLASVHQHPISQGLPRRDGEPPWSLARPDLAQQSDRIAGELLQVTGGRIAELYFRVHHAESLTLVHGRFSTAQCVPTESGMAVLGWREAGFGDPMQDLGYLLGEIAEAAAVTGMCSDQPAERGRPFVEALLKAYESTRGEFLTSEECGRLASWAARRVLNHMAINIAVYGQVQGPLQLLRSAGDVLLDLLFELAVLEG